MSSYSPHSATYKNLKNVAGMLNSPTFRRASGSTDKEKREKRRSKEMIDAQLKADVSICLEDLKRLRRLGEGGFAIVDLFEWQRGSERVEIAVKRLKTKIPGPPDPLDPDRINWIDPPEHWYATFQAEALLLKALRHPNVVACYGCVQVSRDRELFDSDEDPLMFAQEYCDGGSLLDKVRNPSSYSGREALSWAHDVAAGMDYLHSRNKGVRIAHRDLKLENILLSNGRAKVGAQAGSLLASKFLLASSVLASHLGRRCEARRLHTSPGVLRPGFPPAGCRHADVSRPHIDRSATLASRGCSWAMSSAVRRWSTRPPCTAGSRRLDQHLGVHHRCSTWRRRRPM